METLSCKCSLSTLLCVVACEGLVTPVCFSLSLTCAGWMVLEETTERSTCSGFPTCERAQSEHHSLSDASIVVSDMT